MHKTPAFGRCGAFLLSLHLPGSLRPLPLLLVPALPPLLLSLLLPLPLRPVLAAGPIDLGDVTAGGDGSGNAPAENTGIDPRNGRFTTGTLDGPVQESDAEGDGQNPSPGASAYVDSVFFITGVPAPGGGLTQSITKSGVTFSFAFGDSGDSAGAGGGGGSWNYILRDRNGGISAPPVRVGGREGFSSAVGIHAAAGITYDLAALRERHGAESVGCFSAYWGLDDCAAGDVNLYAILSSEATGVIAVRSARFLGGGGAFLEPLEIPATARYLTLATGANGDGTCDHGTFALPFISAGPCLAPSFVTLRGASPSIVAAAGGDAITITGDGFTSDLTVRIGGAPLGSQVVLDTRRIQGACPALSAGLHDVEVSLPGGPPLARLPGAVEAILATGPRTSLAETFRPADLGLEEITMAPDGRAATRVTLKGAAPDPTAHVGFPVLPCVIRQLAIPSGARIQGAALAGRFVVRATGRSLVDWRQSPQPGQAGAHVPRPPEPTLGPDGPVYFPPPAIAEPMHPSVLAAGIWPPEAVSIEGTAEVGGFQVVTLKICPVRWSPADGSISLVETAGVVVYHEGGTLPTGPSDDYAISMERESVRQLLANRDLVPPPTSSYRKPETLDAQYLIITDDHWWNENKTSAGGQLNVGDLPGEFERLAQWKRQRGIQAAVVTVTDILGGRYGSVGANQARDLQEVLRNFLKLAHRRFGTHWVLLGGEPFIVPVRRAICHMGGGYTLPVQSNPKPGAFQAYANAAGQYFHVQSSELAFGLFFENKVLDPDTNILYKWVSTPGPQNPGWTFAKDNSYTTSVSDVSSLIRLYGPSTTSPPSVLYTVSMTNNIPTDLYYASIESPLYDQPGIHDWDQNQNGIFGELYGEENSDGVDFWPTLSVGRVPAASALDARQWINKLLAYEKYEGLPPDFGRRLLLSSSNWWSPPAVTPGGENPPQVNMYYSADGSTEARCRFAGPAGTLASQFDLIGYNSPSDYWTVPFSLSPKSGELGYYYTLGQDYVAPSLVSSVPIPTAFVRVLGPVPKVHPKSYFFDYLGPDGSVLEKEEVKGLFETRYPEVDVRSRFYADFEDTPGFPQPDLQGLTATALIAPLSAGQNIASLSGHGWWTGCCGLASEDVFQFKNGLRCGMIYADSCLTNRFTEPDSLSKGLLASSVGGAVAYVGNTTLSWIGIGHKFEMLFWDRLRVLRHIGWALNSKASFQGDRYSRWINLSMNLLGCPEMSVWTGAPEPLAIDYDGCIQATDPVTVTVTAGGLPQQGAIVTLTDEAGFFAQGISSVTGIASFAGPFQKGQLLTVTASLSGLIPAQGYIGVQTLQCISVVFYRGDSNSDGKLDLSDAVNVLDFLFLGGSAPPCSDAADVNDDGKVNISDAIRLLGFLFLGDPAPPGYEPGHPQVDDTPDNLDCAQTPAGVPGR